MNNLPILVDREAELRVLAGLFEAIRRHREPVAAPALDVLRGARVEDLFACSDARAVFVEWQRSIRSKEGRPPGAALAAHGLTDDVSPCDGCLTDLDDTLRWLREVAENRMNALRWATSSETWERNVPR